ncbi:Organic radical activating enzyme [Thermosyntropha lipolytica DSM 11003]|uniref:7-carboxy-7-deazaguanine synthase n=1 Tax=Thermosyntropha lipolytica DSM 11003 TaxID=1123382 RepID=A0A1M5PD70_9FIRM|nr:7-carboxy-7-deazaguanine synthase QueE [Thermosyntropha lipolytica]SHG99700.1 Organic radical activating enzyme [Thermosyntropha lipolytica DSM 11003]
MKAYLIEIMESIQGEGLTAGMRQIFLRFGGCNLRCSYCDTGASLATPEEGFFYPQAGNSRSKEAFKNPLDTLSVIELVRRFSSSWISFTGGEPLLWSDFVRELGLKLKPAGYRFLLETNGTLVEELDKCLPLVDLISMDFKLPSATGKDNWDNHYFFLREAVTKPCYVKIVANQDTREDEIYQAFDIIGKIDRKIPVYLQPVTKEGRPDLKLLPFLLRMQEKGLNRLEDVRIMPQLHVFLGLM